MSNINDITKYYSVEQKKNINDLVKSYSERNILFDQPFEAKKGYKVVIYSKKLSEKIEVKIETTNNLNSVIKDLNDCCAKKCTENETLRDQYTKIIEFIQNNSTKKSIVFEFNQNNSKVTIGDQSLNIDYKFMIILYYNYSSILLRDYSEDYQGGEDFQKYMVTAIKLASKNPKQAGGKKKSKKSKAVKMTGGENEEISKTFKRKPIMGLVTPYDLTISTNLTHGTIKLIFKITSDKLPLNMFIDGITSKISPRNEKNRTNIATIVKFFKNEIKKTFTGFIQKGQIITFIFDLKKSNGTITINEKTENINVGFKDVMFNLFTEDILNSNKNTTAEKFLGNFEAEFSGENSKTFKRKPVGIETSLVNLKITPYNLRISTNLTHGTIKLIFKITSDKLPLNMFIDGITSKISPRNEKNRTNIATIVKFFKNEIKKTFTGFIQKGQIITFIFDLKKSNGTITINEKTENINVGFKDVMFNLFTEDILNSNNKSITAKIFLQNSVKKIENSKKNNKINTNSNNVKKISTNSTVISNNTKIPYQPNSNK